jgi:hypothetical protein
VSGQGMRADDPNLAGGDGASDEFLGCLRGVTVSLISRRHSIGNFDGSVVARRTFITTQPDYGLFFHQDNTKAVQPNVRPRRGNLASRKFLGNLGTGSHLSDSWREAQPRKPLVSLGAAAKRQYMIARVWKKTHVHGPYLASNWRSPSTQMASRGPPASIICIKPAPTFAIAVSGMLLASVDCRNKPP